MIKQTYFIITSNPEKFQKELSFNIKDMQKDNLTVEIQYQHNGTDFSALVFGREKNGGDK